MVRIVIPMQKDESEALILFAAREHRDPKGTGGTYYPQGIAAARLIAPRRTPAAGSNSVMPRGAEKMSIDRFHRGTPVLLHPLEEIYFLILTAKKKRAAKTVASNESPIQQPAISADITNRSESGNISYDSTAKRSVCDFHWTKVERIIENLIEKQPRAHKNAKI